MYEIWLLLNIVFEVALKVWPLLVATFAFPVLSLMRRTH
jgi:hypothetical protein